MIEAVIMHIGFDISGRYAVFRTLLAICTVLGFSYGVKCSLKYDISYEIYLVHMVVVNVFVQMGYTGDYIYCILLIVIVVTLSIAIERLKKFMLLKIL